MFILVHKCSFLFKNSFGVKIEGFNNKYPSYKAIQLGLEGLLVDVSFH
jgi:hypothetical protein